MFSSIYSGFQKILVDHELVEDVYNGREVMWEEEWGQCFPHQFLMLTSNMDNKKTAIVRFISENKPLLKMRDFIKEGGLHNGRIKPKNKEQSYALNLLMDPNVHCVSLVGAAGSGKTLLALAAALEQSEMKSFKTDANAPKPLYDKVITSRPVMPMGKDIGFLPGSLEDKWLLGLHQFLITWNSF
jgi:PhoH-like ATPase